MKWEIITTLLLIYCAAVESDSKIEPTSGIKSANKKLVPQDSLLSNSSIASNEEPFTFRLPNNSIPLRYDLFLRTDIHRSDFDFYGHLKIHIKVIEATEEITLHYRETIIDKIDLLDVDESLLQSNLHVEYDERLEFLKITLPSLMPVNAEMILVIDYVGELSGDDEGFYYASYYDYNDNRVRYVATQLCPTEARHAMPCYDEPRFRAPFGLEIQHGAVFHAISNMPVESLTPVEGTDMVKTKFQDTPPLPTYLLAFIVSNFPYIGNNDPKTEQRFYSLPENIDDGRYDFALSVAGPILSKLEEHFDMPFPLSKLDHAGLNWFIWGYMENFGLMTYYDRNLMLIPGRPQEPMATSILETVAFQLASQYFGNIVSPAHWSYIWLNDGLSTLYSNYIPSLIWPESEWMERFRLFGLYSAFTVDSVERNPKPLNFYVETVDDIRDKFISIASKKGASVMRMFQEALTIPTFTKGLKYYLNEMYFQTATPKDLHRSLQRAYDEDHPGNAVDLDEVMTTWEDQAGYPLIRVQKIGDKISLTQSRFGNGDEIYSIPVSYATLSAPEFNDKTPKLWLKTESVEFNLLTEIDWIILNIDSTGYYKVSYDKSSWEALANGIKTNPGKISDFHRGQLFNDMKTSLEDEPHAVQALEMLSYLDQENLLSVLTQVSVLENFVSARVFGTTVFPKYQEFIRKVVEPHRDRLGFDDIDGESNNDFDMRDWMKTLSCKHFDENCLNYELEKLVLFMETGEGSFKICDGLRLADEEIHSNFVNRMLTNSNIKREYIRNGLGCSLNSIIINNYLSLILNTTNGLMAVDRSDIIEYTMDKSVMALDASLDFMVEHFDALKAMIPGYLKTVLFWITGLINTNEHRDKLQEIFDLGSADNYFPQYEIDARIAEVNKNLKWNELNLDEIEIWLNDEGQTETSSASTPTTDETSETTEQTSTTITTSSESTSQATTETDETTNQTTDQATTTAATTSESTSQVTNQEATTLGSASLFVPIILISFCTILNYLTAKR